MRSKKIPAILLCTVMLFCALVPVVSAETVTDRSGSWALGNGWSDMPAFRFNNYGKETLTFTNPNVADETNGNWSVETDVLFDPTYATPDQRFNLEIYMASGDIFYITVQRRTAAKNLRTQLAATLDGATKRTTMNFDISGDQGTLNTSGAKPDLWFQSLPAANTAAMQAEASFHVSVSYTDGAFVVSFRTLDGTHLFTLTGSSLDSTAANYIAAKADRISKVSFLPDTSGTTNYWMIANLAVSGAAGVNSGTANIKNYAIGNGWESLNGFELQYTNTENNKQAKWQGSIPADTEFSMQYDLTYLELTYDDLTDSTDRPLHAMTQFNVGDVTVLLRVSRRYHSTIWKNYFTLEVKRKGDTSWEKILDKWVNTPEYTGYRVRIERDEEGFLVYNIFSLSGKLLVNFYDDKSGAHTGEVSNLRLYGQNGYGKWKYNNMHLTVGDPAVEDARFTESVMWELDSGWQQPQNGSMLINSSRSNGTNTNCRLLVNARGTFTFSYDLTFLTIGADTASNTTFRLAGKTFNVCIERLKLDGAWKNRLTVSVDGETVSTKLSETASSTISVTIKHDKPASGDDLRLALVLADGSELSWGTTEEALGLAAGAFDGLLSEITFTGSENNGIYAISQLRLDVTRDTASDFRLVGIQTTAIDTTNAGSPKTDIRLIGVLDSLDYEAIGMDVLGYLETVGETPERTFHTESKTVYASILASEDGAARKITAKELGGQYIWALTVCGVPASGTVIFVVTPYTMKDGSKTELGTYELTFTNGAFVRSVKR